MVLHSKLILKRWRNKSAAQLLAAEWFRDTVVCRGMVPRHRRQSRNSSAKTKFFKSPRRTLSEYPCGGLARTLFSAFRRRKFRQSAADPIGSAAEQICSAAVRRVRGGFRGGIFCSAAKLNLADSAGVRRGPARTQADPGGVRGGIVPPWELPDWAITTSAETQMENQVPGATTQKELHHDLNCVTYQTAARFRE